MPANLRDCWHLCCLLTTVHSHDEQPERCADCDAVTAKSERAVALVDRALRIAAAKHPELSPEERER